MEHHGAEGHGQAGVHRWAVELGMALFIALVGAVVVQGSLEQGVGWSVTGPESGYFPFYIGILIVASAVIIGASAIRTKVHAMRHAGTLEVFVRVTNLVRVLQVFLPTVAYVAAVYGLGLYIASALFVAGFMAWHGGYRVKALVVGAVTPVFFYLVLELWFSIELYKGPLLTWLLER